MVCFSINSKIFKTVRMNQKPLHVSGSKSTCTVDWVSLVRNLLDDDAEWVTLLRHSLDNHPCERKVSETSFTLGKSLKFIPLGRRRLQFFAITNFIRKPYFPQHLSRNTKFQYLYYTNQNIVFELSIL